MEKKAYIFIGRSGCGKGTQVDLLEKLSKESGVSSLRLETGKYFRDFIIRPNITHTLSKTIYEAGGLQPEFLTVHIWSTEFVENYHGQDVLFIDGTPRKLHEAQVLNTALDFYGFTKRIVVHLDVSREWSKERLLARGRRDDNADDIERRLNWFETDVQPAIDYYKNNPKYTYLQINGERPIDEIHADIVARIS